MKVPGGAFKEIFFLAILALIIVAPLRVFVAQPFVVEGDSMFPTFESGDYLIVDQLTYRLENPKRGDVVVFRYPINPKVFYIKRIIGLPGETVHINKGKTSITKTDGMEIELDESYVVAEDATYTLDRSLGTDQYFVMGDNRPRSSDSRTWGVLPKEDLMGRAYIRLLPAGKTGVLPGAVTEIQ
ncbi:MAG: signal peptidase I [Parcubacteria bacterium C7867-004]|nr:MAG: signal peptidase I [Parcubacteria bacterium C7867-004]